MELTDRKKKILQYVVDDYIETAVPVSSKSLTERHLKNISSATIRNELSALEELGYLTQLHTSSGRVPSAEAYKLYVSELMVKDKLSVKDLDYIKKIFLEKADNMEEVIKNTTKVRILRSVFRVTIRRRKSRALSFSDINRAARSC